MTPSLPIGPRRQPARPALVRLEDRLAPAGGIDVTPALTHVVVNNWGTGYQAQVTVTNDRPFGITGWRLEWDYPPEVETVWNVRVADRRGDHYAFEPMDWNATIPAGKSVTFGFVGSPGGAVPPPTDAVLSWSGTTEPPADPPAQPASPPPAATAASPGGVSVQFVVRNDWGSGFTADVVVRNAGAAPVNNWVLGFDFPYAVTNIWNGVVETHTGNRYTVRNAGHNATIPAGGSVTFGFNGAPGNVAAGPVNYTLNGVPVGTSPPPASPPPTSPPPPVPSLSVNDVSVVEPSGSAAAGTGYLRTSGNQIVDQAGTPVRLAGVNWFGMETNTFAPHGLWARGYRSMMDQMKALGFNTIRLPFSNQLFDAGSTPNGIDPSKNPDLAGLSGLQIMDKVVAYAGQIGLRILLDNHRSDAGGGPNGSGLWYTAAYPESRWLSDWQMLAARYANNPTVVGADLANEPHGPATWGGGNAATDWRLAAERAGAAIHAVNPNWLIVVEGVEAGPSGNYWWGGNLSAAGQFPVRLTVPNRLVYSPHDYPASVYPQPWFGAANYPANLPALWDATWGYLYKQNVAPVLLGEFGTKLQTASDQQWLSALTAYLGSTAPAGQPQGMSWTWWSWNPNSGDTGGILADDWQTPQAAKVTALQPIQYAALPPAGTGPATAVAAFTVRLSAPAAAPVSVGFSTQDGTARAGQDYVARSGTLTFAAGETEKRVEVTVLADALTEGAETFRLVLTNPANATLADGEGLGTVRDPV